MITQCPYCEMTTAGGHRRDCPNHPDNQLRGSYGWQCPVCGQVNAPWVFVCTGYHSLTDSINKITISSEMWQKWGTS